MGRKIIAYGLTDPGLKRTNNEDAFLVREDAGVVAVVDGMGGAAAGEVASALAVAAIDEVFDGRPPDSPQAAKELVSEAFGKAHGMILDHVSENPEHKGMGCTAEVLAFHEDGYLLGHVGDSRTYALRDGEFRQLSKDHSLVQQQVEQGILDPGMARNHHMRNVILRAVGVDENLAVDLVTGNAAPGDLFLLCSDGLSDMVEDDVLDQVLSSPLDLPAKARRLVELAKEAGGADNITVILAMIP